VTLVDQLDRRQSHRYFLVGSAPRMSWTNYCGANDEGEYENRWGLYGLERQGSSFMALWEPHP
jgi:hypothetical protein